MNIVTVVTFLLNVVVIDHADMTELVYVCLWVRKSYQPKFLRLLNSCYPMVGRSSEVSLSNMMTL